MKRSYALRQTGVTLTELLVVLVIISILSTIAVPVYINKAENARRATAEAECKAIADAEETCAAHHGFYVPLQVLNDMPAGTGVDDNANAIDKEGTTVFVVDPSKPATKLDQGPTAGSAQPNLINVPTGSSVEVVAAGGLFDQRVINMIRTWQGPFLNTQRIAFANAGETYRRYDFPMDPWGQPYRFYAPYPFGLIGTDASNSDYRTNFTNFSDGLVTTVEGTERRFDRFAVVSWGSNGVPNKTSDIVAGYSQADDIIYLFGRTLAVETNYNGGITNNTTPTPTATP